jgi:endonuclease/exonuclease/phosphatase (EEP) superfamily protein YafD
MIDTILVSLTVMAGILGLAGLPLRCWQIASGRFRSRIPQHALARATFSLCTVVFLVPNTIAWIYALFAIYRDLSCAAPCAQAGVTSAVAVGMLGCAYVLLEGFLLTARRRATPVAGDRNSA